MKVAIYARYSSENQRDASIADQFRVCREFAQRQGWHIARRVLGPRGLRRDADAAGFQAMMREALRRQSSTSSSPRRSIDSAATRKTPPASSSASRSPA